MDPKDASKVEARSPFEPHVEGESRGLVAPLHLLKLEEEIEQLRKGETFQRLGQEAKTLVKLPHLRMVLFALAAGAGLQKHRADGDITIHVLSGSARLRLEGQTVELIGGQLLVLQASVVHDLEAIQDSAVLLTIARNQSIRPSGA